MKKNKVRIFVLLYSVDKKLKDYGIKPIIEDLNMKYKNYRKKVTETSDIVQICKDIDSVCQHHPLKSKALCLHKSLVGYMLIKKLGYDIAIHIGIARETFEAHAWLEYNGKVINDNEEYIRSKYLTTFKS
ncbi:lasso peptide biosynthesis B2 protein [Halobacillus amylolyticus]|uniref:Lasso peptide biosynthesis B2 protein n=1 Tax=Halobacillus amylolyticus TaxID=2932259 RepID=A0ABY4HGZ5_9BACI|nr:lasso peptide biosynthesis B2 protein [Halobacillus amylolyticus]UOR14186.1 lasso peptide biosynthesis B2 protein [Halobacillus amylolyticus]